MCSDTELHNNTIGEKNNDEDHDEAELVKKRDTNNKSVEPSRGNTNEIDYIPEASTKEKAIRPEGVDNQGVILSMTEDRLNEDEDDHVEREGYIPDILFEKKSACITDKDENSQENFILTDEKRTDTIRHEENAEREGIPDIMTEGMATNNEEDADHDFDMFETMTEETIRDEDAEHEDYVLQTEKARDAIRKHVKQEDNISETIKKGKATDTIRYDEDAEREDDIMENMIEVKVTDTIQHEEDTEREVSETTAKEVATNTIRHDDDAKQVDVPLTMNEEKATNDEYTELKDDNVVTINKEKATDRDANKEDSIPETLAKEKVKDDIEDSEDTGRENILKNLTEGRTAGSINNDEDGTPEILAFREDGTVN